MKQEFCYLMLDIDGACWRVVDRTTEEASLPALLADGWRPVRETSFAPHDSASSPYILICLEREPEGQMGFGFGQ